MAEGVRFELTVGMPPSLVSSSGRIPEQSCDIVQKPHDSQRTKAIPAYPYQGNEILDGLQLHTPWKHRKSHPYFLWFQIRHRNVYSWTIASNKQIKVLQNCAFAELLAEGVRFELTVDCSITSFQDWLLKPLGQPSNWKKLYHFFRRKSRAWAVSDFGLDKEAAIC